MACLHRVKLTKSPPSSEQLADAMLRTEPHNMRLLSETALNNFGLTETDPIEQETDDLEQARSYGLDRMEYMRRKSLVERLCPPWTQGVDANSACEQKNHENRQMMATQEDAKKAPSREARGGRRAARRRPCRQSKTDFGDEENAQLREHLDRAS